MSSPRVHVPHSYPLEWVFAFWGSRERIAARQLSRRFCSMCRRNAMEELLNRSVSNRCNGRLLSINPCGGHIRALMPISGGVVALCREVLERFPDKLIIVASRSISETLHQLDATLNLRHLPYLLIAWREDGLHMSLGSMFAHAFQKNKSLVSSGNGRCVGEDAFVEFPVDLSPSCIPAPLNILSSLDFSSSTPPVAPLRSLSDGAFCKAHNLREVNLSGSPCLSSIGANCFAECPKLSRLSLENCVGLREIGDGAFERCPALEHVSLLGCASLQSVGKNAFFHAEHLTSVDLSQLKSVQYLRDRCWSSCEKLTSVNLSGCSALRELGRSCFHSCRSLTSVNFSGCVALRSVGPTAFEDTGVVAMDFSGAVNLQTLGDDCLRNCMGLVSVSLCGCGALCAVGRALLC